MIEPANDRYTEDEHEADTVPSGIQPLPSPPPVPKFTPVPDMRRTSDRWRFAKWAAPAVVGTLVIAVAIANTVAFLEDMSELGGGMYAAGVVASSAIVGALAASAWWAGGGMR